MIDDFGLGFWGQDSFKIIDNTVNVNYGNKPSLHSIAQEIRSMGHRGPLLLRFPHLIREQIDMLFGEFARARRELSYRGDFHAVFPLKVNQYPKFVNTLMQLSSRYHYGLEAGSKPELILALSKTAIGSPITINGFKDREMISLAYIGAKSGHNITIIIEGLTELKTLIELYGEFNQKHPNPISPKIGMRIRLHSTGIGVWAKSGGYGSKFGLTSTELLEAYDILDRHGLLESFTMIHFHIGSQMGEIGPLKKALREAGNIYSELRRKGAYNLNAINIGGGLAVEYGQDSTHPEKNYSLGEFANDVVYMMQEISRSKNVPEPDIYTESGRFVAAKHAVLIAPVLELFSQEYHERSLRLKETNPPLVKELYELYLGINKTNAREYLHDAFDHMESLLTLFDLGYIDLIDRSNTEILVHLIIKRSISLLPADENSELNRLQNHIQERYLVNFSTFQSLPDFWGLGQHFPVMPISHLDIRPTRPASIWDITCDSDGEIAFDPSMPLYLHDVDVDEDEYFLAFFLSGAYQEVLGMKHNLFTHPTEATVEFDINGKHSITHILEAQNLMDILEDIDYDIDTLQSNMRQNLLTSPYINTEERKELLNRLEIYLGENSYLKTTQNKTSRRNA